MAKKLEKLKKFYVTNGGDAADVAGIKSLGDMIDALCNIEFDSELPTVTGTDNGKILAVVEGAWAKSSLPDFTPFEVDGTVTVDGTTYKATITTTTTAQQLFNALAAGKMIKFVFGQEGEDPTTMYTIPNASLNGDSYNFSVVFSGVTFATGNLDATDTIVFEQS